MDRGTLLRANRLFVNLCASWASLSVEFNLKQGILLRIFNKVTLIWSAIIFTTSSIKFLRKREQLPPARETISTSEQCLKAILLLDYMPNIGSFANLYYGLMIVTIGAPLAWRLYLTYYRSRQACPLSKATSQQVVHFLLQGPKLEAPFKAQNQQRLNHQESQRWLHWIEHLLHPQRPTSGRSWLFSDKPLDRWNKPGPLSLAHRAHIFNDDPCLEEVFLNPIRSNNLLLDESYEHWIYLVKIIYSLVLMATILSFPILWLILRAFVGLVNRFSASTEDPNLYQHYLTIYGFFELAYACSEASMFFVFTNLFMGLFYADLTYKMRPISHTLKAIKRCYCKWPGALTETEEKARLTQLKLWAYFDQIDQIDHLVSKYSLVSIVTFISGLCFAQSYISFQDMTIFYGAIATFVANLISFVFLYVISWRLETRSTRLYTVLMSILAHEPNFVAKRGWQRTIYGFYQVDWKRTFTMDEHYPLNLQSLMKIIFALLTISLLIMNLFYK